jgi:hypothetical protein
MSYESELQSLLNWVKQHDGMTTAELERSLRAVPWPAGEPNTWKQPYDGTRMDSPSIACLTWKLRYMELAGDLRQEKGKWFAMSGPVLTVSDLLPTWHQR